MVKRPLILLVLFAVLLASCAKAAGTPTTSRSSEGSPPVAMPQEEPALAALDSSAGSYAYEAAAVNRIVIRNASLTIVVADPAQAMEAVLKLADDMNGFVVNSQLYQRGEMNGVKIQEASVSIRVPAERIEEARTRIKALVEDPKTDVLSDSVTGQDVTQQYTDLQSRLRNEEDAAEQLRKIMDTATKPEDVLQIFSNLKQVNEQIEILKGQIKYFDEASAMSEISVAIQSKQSVQPISVAGWSPKGVARNALQALVDIYQFLASAAIWIGITLLPVLVPPALIIFGIVKLVQRQRRKNRTSKVDEAGMASK